MQKYKFAEIVFHWKNESKNHISCVALKSQTELEIEDDSEEDRELFYYFNSYEELLENPEVDNQQPSLELTIKEGSETNR